MLPVLSLVCSFFIAVVCLPAQQAKHSKTLAPYVPSPQRIVDRMLEAAALKPGETLYDLGSGDGRIVITAAQKFGAKAVGVELSDELAKSATDSIRKMGLQERARIIHGNLLEADLSEADVVTLYLLTHANEQIRPRLEKFLKPGARVVSHDFEVRGWKPARVERVPAYNRDHLIYIYEVPARR